MSSPTDHLPVIRVYVTQYDVWWSFTPDQWRAWLTTALPGIRSGLGYRLPEENHCSARPNSIRGGSRSAPRLYSKRRDVRVVQPLDWSAGEWEDELAKSAEVPLASTPGTV